MGTHIAEKWMVVEGPLSKSGPGRTGKIICRSCGGREGRDAIQIEKTAERREGRVPEPAPSPPPVPKDKSAGAKFFERHWGWVAIFAGFIAAGYVVEKDQSARLLVVGFAAAALTYFGWWSPAPCVGSVPFCEEEARGIRRRCPDPDHRTVNRASVRALFAEGRWPRAVWGDWPARRALLGLGLSIFLLWGSGFGYLRATYGLWVAVPATLGLIAVVPGGIALWRRRAATERPAD